MPGTQYEGGGCLQTVIAFISHFTHADFTAVIGTTVAYAPGALLSLIPKLTMPCRVVNKQDLLTILTCNLKIYILFKT